MSEETYSTLQRVSDGRRQRLKLDFRDWPVQLLCAAIGAAFVGQLFLGEEGVLRGAVSAEALREGRWWTLVSSQFLHGGLAHLLFNLSALAGLGGAVMSRFGRSLRGGLAFLAFFLTCGVLAGLGFAAVNAAPAIGASGAIFGLWAAGARAGGREAGLNPLFGKAVGRETWSAIVSNLVLVGALAVFGLMTGGGLIYIAWEAHAAGFVAGLLLVGPFLWLAGNPKGEPAPEVSMEATQ